MAPTLEAPLAVIIWHHLTEKEEFARKNLGGDFNAMLGIHKRAQQLTPLEKNTS